ncbi:ArnT family glycosyltransferase [Actinomycetospora soli]|uniref:ArnT family glycosyltransferase n=1 Tax=Actinomycetospora soli TaxID=2893887 RepID=UPI001E4763A7|nr:glycosyltransferase family 39 protein [Actinomycetospora soli]MCD2189722.1 glycosyltransferase family 39 protein [Actinomycetospora soli]
MSTVTAPPPPVGTRAVPPLAAAAGLVAGLVGVVQFVLSVPDGRWFDEVLMLAIGRHHLDWGSADQPPVAPLLAAAADAIAPDRQWVMRLPVVLASAGAVLLAALIARELGGDRRAQTLAATAQATGIWATLFGHWLTPYALEPVQWLAIGWLLVRWVRTRDDRLLVALGLVVGIAAQTKFQVFGLCAALLVAVALCGPRTLLRRPLLWVGALLAAAIAAPTLIWQAAHGWPQLAMGAVVAAEAGPLYGGRAGVAAATVVGAGLLGAPLGAYGLVRLLRTPDLRFLGVTTAVVALLVVLAPGRPYYLAGLYGLLAAAGAVGLQGRREAGRARFRWVAWPASALAVALAAAVLHLSTALASPVVPDRIVAATATATATANAHDALPAPERDRTAIVGGSYIYAAYVDAAPRALGLPPAASLNRSYGYFTPPSDDLDAALYVGPDPGVLRGSFAQVRRVGEISGDGARGLGGEDLDTPVWLLTGRQEPWAAIWERERTLVVS